MLDELGLMHGSCRADIAVVNGRLLGYEIKSDQDTLNRLERQIPAYDAIFDAVTLIVSDKHRVAATRRAPKHWGVIISARDKNGEIKFRTGRKAKSNPNVDPLSLTRLLWRNEAAQILTGIDANYASTHLPRAALYAKLADTLSLRKLKETVRSYLKKRKDWRGQTQPSPDGGLFQPISK